MKLKNIVMALGLLAVAAVSFAMPPREGIKEPSWVIDARKAGMDSPKDGLIQQLRAKDASAKISGSRSYPVVIGYFTDTASTYTRDTIQLRLFNTGTNVMSVNNYYRDMSYNAMSCSGSVTSWVNSGHTLAYFGNGNNGLTTSDTIQSAYGFIKHTLVACDAAVDFSDPAYDQNSDGYVDVLWVVHAGRGGEEGSANDIWSHSWQLTYWRSGAGKIFTTNDPRPGYAGQYMKIDKYIIMPEKTLYADNNPSTVDLIGCGVFCHEFGHALGLPDLYDVALASNGIEGQGLGLFSLMAAGSWGGNYGSGGRPVALDLWCRRYLGWASPIRVTNNNRYTVKSIMGTSDSSSYKLARLGSDTTKQYWLIENRYKNQQGPVSGVRWDSLMYGSVGGLLIYHIDTTYTSGTYFTTNHVNSNSTNGTNRNRPYGVALEETDMTSAGYRSELWNSTNYGEAVDVWNSGTQTSFDSTGTAYPVTYLNGTDSTTGGAHTMTAVRAIPAASAAMACSMFVAVPTGVEGQPQAGPIPEAFVLGNAYPNPAKGQVTISYQLPQAGRATMEIYNMLGQTVQKFDLGYQPAGTHSLNWNSSQQVQGVYFYRLQSGDFSSTKKLVLVK
jgi:M6 family metalloprotease-like protein